MTDKTKVNVKVERKQPPSDETGEFIACVAWVDPNADPVAGARSLIKIKQFKTKFKTNAEAEQAVLDHMKTHYSIQSTKKGLAECTSIRDSIFFMMGHAESYQHEMSFAITKQS